MAAIHCLAGYQLVAHHFLYEELHVVELSVTGLVLHPVRLELNKATNLNRNICKKIENMKDFPLSRNIENH